MSSRGTASLCHDARGAVLLETLIAFMPIFVLFLGAVQLTLLAAARLVVAHAASVGARSAVVVLTDDPRYYDGSEPGSIHYDFSSLVEPSTASPSSTLPVVAEDSGFVAPTPKAPGLNDLLAMALGDSPRMREIRRAVHTRLTAIVPDQSLVGMLVGARGAQSVAAAIGSSSMRRLLIAAVYLHVTTAITFPIAPGSSELHEEQVPSDGDVIVRVTTLYPCVVPMAAALICKPFRAGSPAEPGQAPPSKAESAAIDDLASAPLSWLQDQVAQSYPRMAILSAEARLPAQGAGYAYPEPSEDGGS